MKILCLKFKNINSLKGEHEIDFTQDDFAQNPLFAITGPTGSGKTTLLDVISLALYNQVPRLGKITNTVIEENGAILTRNQKEAYAEVVYECQQGKFASTWSISTNRNDNLRPYEMELVQLEPKQVLDLKKSEVPDKNKALIGLSYSQFIKSVMLAQGEFAKFLKAGKTNRSNLLEKITGTGIYRELGMRAYQKYKAVTQETKDTENIIENYEQELLSKEKIIDFKEDLKSVNAVIKEHKKRLEVFKSQLKLIQDLKELQQSILQKQEALKQANADKEAFDQQHNKRLNNHESVQEFSGELQSWKNQKTNIDEINKDLNRLNKDSENDKTTYEKLLREIRTLLQKDVQPDKATEGLNVFYEKFDALNRQREDLLKAYQSKKILFDRELSDFDAALNTKEFIREEEKWIKLIETFKDEERKLIDTYAADLPSDIASAINQRTKKIEVLQNAQSDAKDLQNLNRNIKEIEIEIKTLEERLKPMPQQIKTLTLMEEKEQLKLDNLREQQKTELLQSELEDLRKNLIDGKACPLCGAEHHPFSKHLPKVESDISKQIKNQENELKKCSDHLSEIENKQFNYNQQLKELIVKKQDNEQSLEKLKIEFDKSYSSKFSFEKEDWQADINTTKRKKQQLETIADSKRKSSALERAQPIYKDLKNLLMKGKKLKKQIDGLYKGQNLKQIVNDLKNAWQEINSNLKHKSETKVSLQDKIKRQKSNLNTFETAFLKRINQAGFKSIIAADSALLDVAVYKDLKMKSKTFNDKVKNLTTEINTLSIQEKKQKSKMETSKDEDSLAEQIEKLITQINQKDRQKSDLERKLKNNDELLEKIQALKTQIKTTLEKNKRWKTLNDLIGSAGGDTFNKFAQNLTLQQLLKLANQRLVGLSDRYRLKMPGEGREDMEVIDLDMGSETRSVKTLSGGESFLLSLSLAMALSDLASKNVKINSLFIDEGFGTLDQETLDQTLDTLERLQAQSSKMIGIISHVESLKERIGTQIQLHRDGRGYSTMKIVTV